MTEYHYSKTLLATVYKNLVCDSTYDITHTCQQQKAVNAGNFSVLSKQLFVVRNSRNLNNAILRIVPAQALQQQS
jgi:hypothetical protein